jgi:hypothetical protein
VAHKPGHPAEAEVEHILQQGTPPSQVQQASQVVVPATAEEGTPLQVGGQQGLADMMKQLQGVGDTGFGYGETLPTGKGGTPLTKTQKGYIYDPAAQGGIQPKSTDQLLYDLPGMGLLGRDEQLDKASRNFQFGPDVRPDSALANIDISEFQRLAGMGQYGSEQRTQLFEVERELLKDIDQYQQEAALLSTAMQNMADLAFSESQPFQFSKKELADAGRAMARASTARERLSSLRDLRERLDVMNQRGLSAATFPQVGALTGLLSNLFGVGPEAFEGLQNLPTSAVSGLIPMLFQQGQAAQQAGIAKTQRQQQQEQQGQLGTALQSLFPQMQGVEAFGAFPSLVPQLFGRRQQAEDIGFRQREAELGRTEAALERDLSQQQLTQQQAQFEQGVAERETQRALDASQFSRQMELAEGQQAQAATEFTEQIRQFNLGLDLSQDELNQRVQEWTDQYNLSETQETRLRDRLTLEQSEAALGRVERDEAYQEQVRQFNEGVRLQDAQIAARASEFAQQYNLSETQETRLRDRLTMEQEFATRQATEQQRLIDQQATQTGQMGGLAELIAGTSGIPGLGGQAQGLALQPQLMQLLLQQALGGAGQTGMMRTSFR